MYVLRVFNLVVIEFGTLIVTICFDVGSLLNRCIHNFSVGLTTESIKKSRIKSFLGGIYTIRRSLSDYRY